MDQANLIINDGRQTLMQQMSVLINNLANANTTGFKEDFTVIKPVDFQGTGLSTRTASQIQGVYSRLTEGPITPTGSDLDVAIHGRGFIAVQSNSGEEGYTRSGNLNRDENGFLKTAAGHFVIGMKGLIKIPKSDTLKITEDGSIYVKLAGQTEFAKINQIKLVDPDEKNLKKSQEGLFQTTDQQPVSASQSVKLIPGSLEGSNVNPIALMAQMIEYSRQFEYQSTLSKKIQENDLKGNSLLSVE